MEGGSELRAQVPTASLLLPFPLSTEDPPSEVFLAQPRPQTPGAFFRLLPESYEGSSRPPDTPSCSCPSGFCQTSPLSLSSFCLFTPLKANATNLRLKNKQKTFLSRGMDKEAVVLIRNGILLSHEKEWNGAICRDMDGPRNGHTE